MPRARRIVIFAAVFVATLALDQGSKAWAHGLPVGVPQPVIHGYWDWELAYNPGMAFSFATSAPLLLGVIAAAALVAIGIAAARTKPEQGLKRAALALVAGGALGNLVDRIREGAVTDFVRWHVHEHMWPIFNIADAALLAGVAMLLIDDLFWRRRAPA